MREVPRLLVITDRTQVPRGRRLGDVVAECVRAGADTVFLRERDLDPASYDAIADTVGSALAPRDGTLLVRDVARCRGAYGVHLRAADPQPRVRPRLLGRSVHHAAQLASAQVAGCDYVTYSPVRPTPSKPGYGPALGAAGIARARASVPGAPPVLALGGVEPGDVAELLAAGAHGVAVMGSVMRARDPGDVVQQLLTHLSPPLAHHPSQEVPS